jgi:hypothetical protein
LKQKLSPEELISLSEYQLQTYIMELSIKEKINDGLEPFVERILAHVKKSKEFWINGKIVSKN